MEHRQTTTNTGPMIDVSNLRRRFKHTEALAGISFCVQRGEIFGLLGPNGAGKTTTIRLLTGQIVPDAGCALVAGCDIVKDLQRLKECIGVVPEEQNLYERLSARQNLHVNCWLYHLPEKRAEEVLDLVHLRERARDPVRTFSHGMKQRLMIARALLHRPAVLFLDEPGRGLDPLSASQVREAIEHLRQERTTILLTTHLLAEADQLASTWLFSTRGRSLPAIHLVSLKSRMAGAHWSPAWPIRAEKRTEKASLPRSRSLWMIPPTWPVWPASCREESCNPSIPRKQL